MLCQRLAGSPKSLRKPKLPGASFLGFAYRIGSPLRYTRSHVVSGVSNNGYGCFADLPYLSDP
jgi:hypothetical protein